MTVPSVDANKAIASDRVLHILTGGLQALLPLDLSDDDLDRAFGSVSNFCLDIGRQDGLTRQEIANIMGDLLHFVCQEDPDNYVRFLAERVLRLVDRFLAGLN
jgi:hypothetical protein